MKAIRVHQFGDPNVLQLEDVPDPTAKAGQVAVNVAAVGVNPVDAYIPCRNLRRASVPLHTRLRRRGTVEAVGDGITHVKPGDRVYVAGAITGTYAEKALCRAAQVQPLPDHITLEQGAAIGVPYGTAFYELYHRAQARPGETLLVHGATGGVGLAAVQLAVAAGLTVIATGGSDEGRRLVAAQGADHVLDHRTEGYLDQIKELAGSKGLNVILEMLANVNLGNDLGLLGPKGRVVVVGSRGKVEISPRDTMMRDATSGACR